MKNIARALVLTAALLLATASLAQASAPPNRFIGQGKTYWEYAGNDGNGNLTVKVDTTSVPAGQADISYTFDSGSQAFFVNSGQVVATGNWNTGWDYTSTNPQSHLHVGPFGDGTSITFHIDGWLVTQSAGIAQGPWLVDGTFGVTQAF